MFVIRRGTDPQDTTIENANMVVTATMADMNAMVIGTEIGKGIVMSPAVMTENAIGIVMEVGVDVKSMMNIPADDMMMNEDGSADLVTRSMVEEAEAEVGVEVEDTVDVEEGVEAEVVVVVEVAEEVMKKEGIVGAEESTEKPLGHLKGDHPHPSTPLLFHSAREKLVAGMSMLLGTNSTLPCKPNKLVCLLTQDPNRYHV